MMHVRWLVPLAVAATRLASQEAPGDTARIRAALSGAGAAVRGFYAARGYVAAWTGDGPAAPAARELVAALVALEQDGLEPRRYGIGRIDRLLAIGGDSGGALDVALTTAFLTAGRHLADGRVRPEAVDSMWRGRRASDVEAALRRAAEQQRPAAELAALAPPDPGYHALRAALARYRGGAAVGGWPRIGRGPLLSTGDSGPRVAALRERLAGEGDQVDARGAMFDSTSAAAVRRFQRRHGLTEDGRVGPATVAALDVSAARRARQIVLNLERWRWVPREAGGHTIVVNTAAFTVTCRSPEGAAYESPAIVGRSDWPTPIVAGAVTGVVFAPAWRVPRAILLREILPAAAGDTGYFARYGFRMVDSTGATLPGDSVGWDALADPTRGLTLVQRPGPQNALGGVKLVFDNPFSVYVHGTTEQALFDRPVRTMSHGCVRAEGALELARMLLAGRPEWPADSIARAAADTVERTVRVTDGTVMVVGYWTAWVGDDGAVHFRPDVYGWDAKLDRALGR